MSIGSILQGRRVLVTGDVMLDEHIQGRVRRLSPEAPVPIVEIQSRRYHPGGAGNVAVNIASLGGQVWLAGVTGADEASGRLRRELAARNVCPDHLLASADRNTTTKSRVMAGSHHIVRFDEEPPGKMPPDLEEQLAARAAGLVSAAEACILSDYAKSALTRRVCQAVIAAARERGIPVIVDPKGADFSKYDGASVVTPNLREARAAAGVYSDRPFEEEEPEARIESVAEALLGRCPASLLITLGAEGMALFERGARPVFIKAQPREVFDVTGAGDTVVATLGLALAAGFPLETACRLGNMAAGIVVGELGAAAITLDALNAAIAAQMPGLCG